MTFRKSCESRNNEHKYAVVATKEYFFDYSQYVIVLKLGIKLGKG